MRNDDPAGFREATDTGEDAPHIADLRELARQAIAERFDPVQTVAALREYVTCYGAGEPEPLTAAASLTAGILADLDQRRGSFLDGRAFLGHATGFKTLDDILGGLETRRLSIALAQPGQGKTTLSNQLAHTVAAQGAPVLYVTFENTREALILRQVARIAGKSVTGVERGRTDPGALAAAFRTFNETATTLYYVTGTKATTVEAIRRHVERIRALHPDAGHPLVVVDYLQRLARTGTIGKTDDARLRVGSVSQELTDLSRDTGAHVWAISSTNRQAYNTDKARANLSSAKESGDIEFDADAVIKLEKPENGSTLAPHGTDALELVVVKNRHGRHGAVSVLRNWETLAFSEADPSPHGNGIGPGGSWAVKAKGGA